MKRYTLVFTVLAQIGCSTGPSITSQLSGHTFSAVMDKKGALAATKDVEAFMVFGSDTSGTFRFKTGSAMVQKGFSWEVDGDSLRLRFAKDSIEMMGKKLVYIPKPTSYLIVKEEAAILLKRTSEQILLTRK